MTKPWLLAFAFVALLITSIGLAACGGSGTSGGTVPTSQPTSTQPVSTGSPAIPSPTPSAAPSPTTTAIATMSPTPSPPPNPDVIAPPTPAPGVSVDPAGQFCASTDIQGPGEPPPQDSCASGTTQPSSCIGAGNGCPKNWANLTAILCNSAGIPAAGLNGFACTDPRSAEIELFEGGTQQFTAFLVQSPLTHPNDIDAPLFVCKNNGLGDVGFAPRSLVVTRTLSSGDAVFNVSQLTVDWWYVEQQNSNQCSVAIWDTHQQFVVVGVGFQLIGGCANSTCTAGTMRRRRTMR